MEHHLTTYITHDTLISALGFGTQENLEAIRSYHSGITLQTDKRIADTPLLAATISQERLQQQAEAIGVSGYPRMEQLFILTINELIRQSGQTLEDKTCGLILSTTKGNIDLLARHTEHPDEASRIIFSLSAAFFLFKIVSVTIDNKKYSITIKLSINSITIASPRYKRSVYTVKAYSDI